MKLIKLMYYLINANINAKLFTRQKANVDDPQTALFMTHSFPAMQPFSEFKYVNETELSKHI